MDNLTESVNYPLINTTMITLKEKKMLLKMKAAMGEPTDELRAEIEAEEQRLTEQSESRKSAFNNIFADLAKNLNELAVQDKKRSEEQQSLVDQLGSLFTKMATDPQVPQEIKEEFVKIDQAPDEIIDQPVVVEKIDQPKPISSVDRVVAHVKETTAPSMFVQPNPPTVDKDIKAIQNKLKLLEGWVSKISMNGPGGGAVWLKDLDDVARSSLLSANNGDVLTYNSTTKKWEASAVSANGVVGTLHQVTTAGNTTNNSLTANGIIANHFAVNTAAGYTVSTGEIAWNAADLTFDMGMASGVVLQVGQEQYIKIKAANNITNGQTVMFAGANGENVLGVPCDMTVPGFRPEWFIGVATQSITKNDFGYITTFGKVHDINTLAWTEGDILYADPAVVGGLTNVEPNSINIMVAAVTKRAGGDGHIIVRPSWRFYLDEINGVTITTPSNGQVLMYISSSNTWVNHSIEGFQTTAGLAANVATLASNNALYLGGIAANQYAYANISSLSKGSDTLSLDGANKVNLPGGTAYIFSAANNITLVSDNTGSNSLEIINNVGATLKTDSSFEIRTNTDSTQRVWSFTQGGSLFFPDSTVQTTAWTGSVATLTSNNSLFLGGIAANQYAYANALSVYQTAAGLSSNVATLTANNTSFVGAVSAANVVSNSQLQSNLANYQTAAGLSANVATLTSNNTLYLGGTAANGYAKLNTNVAFDGVSSNTPVAFIAGIAANSGVALQMPHEGALRNMSNTSSTMYFDVNNGGAAHGYFNFRSSNNFTSILHLGVSQVTFNSGAAITGQTPYVGRTSYNVALDTVVTVDNLKYRISNQGGIFPQIASANGSGVDVCYDVLGVVSGAGTTMAQNSGYILAADGTWLSIYSAHGMDTRSDRLTAHVTDKAAGKIYRVTYMVTNNSGNATGYNIIVERII